MSKEEINSENEPSARDAAIANLSKENQKWLRAWEKDGWSIDLVELEWCAEKLFEGDTERHVITGLGSIVGLLTEIERVEADRKAADDPTPEDAGEAPEDANQAPTQVEFVGSDSPRVVIRQCRVKLTDDEKSARHLQMLKTMDEKDEVVSQFESVKDTHKSRVKSIEADIRSLRVVCNTGVEWRDVECFEKFNYETWTVTVVRSDTGETVEKRPMTKHERQNRLF